MVVLKGVPPLLSRELLYALARMGPGDETILADANFRTSSLCQCGPTEICADGLGIPHLLEVVVKLLLLDSYMESPAAIMELVPSNRTRGLQIPLWRHYKYHLPQAGCTNSLEKFERFAFYERSKKAVAVVATRRMALCGNVNLKKGVLAPDDLLQALESLPCDPKRGREDPETRQRCPAVPHRHQQAQPSVHNMPGNLGVGASGGLLPLGLGSLLIYGKDRCVVVSQYAVGRA
nr:fucose mutarotase isoform X1 [Loxodonta africana]